MPKDKKSKPIREYDETVKHEKKAIGFRKFFDKLLGRDNQDIVSGTLIDPEAKQLLDDISKDLGNEEEPPRRDMFTGYTPYTEPVKRIPLDPLGLDQLQKDVQEREIREAAAKANLSKLNGKGKEQGRIADYDR
jgi:hypothetical protein